MIYFSPGDRKTHDIKYDRTPLFWATQNRYERRVSPLPEQSEIKPEEADNQSQTPLYRAIAYRYEGIVRMLLERRRVNTIFCHLLPSPAVLCSYLPSPSRGCLRWWDSLSLPMMAVPQIQGQVWTTFCRPISFRGLESLRVRL